MNIPFGQVERKTPFALYVLQAFGILTAMMLTLSFNRYAELHWTVPSISGQVIQTIEISRPSAIPAPLPPAGPAQPVATSEPVGAGSAILVPQVVAAPAPSVP